MEMEAIISSITGSSDCKKYCFHLDLKLTGISTVREINASIAASPAVMEDHS